MDTTDRELNKMVKDSPLLFTIFILSRGVFNLRKEQLVDYSRFVIDITDEEYLHPWMEFDKMYLFRVEDLKKEAKNDMIPFSYIFPIGDFQKMNLVDGPNCLIKFIFNKRFFVLHFPNIIECWKFYYYGRILHYNTLEFYKSLSETIDINMRILFDDYRQTQVPTVIASIININNKKKNLEEFERTKQFIDDDCMNFKELSILYKRMLVGVYSMEHPEKYFKKMRIITEMFHKYYFQYIKELFSNQYTDVG